jgi:DNA repair protein RecN (Recombination protein N)
MLRQITVSHYALIEHVQLDWSPGLTAITGETGSGKSILIGALGLLLGERADLKTLDLRDQKCIVEAIFDVRKADLGDFFRENDLDADDFTTVRREITSAGKSRTFINDTPVSLQTLRELSSHLVDIHSQHENQLLGKTTFQFDILDQVAAHASTLADYRNLFQQWKELKSSLEATLTEENKLRQDADYMRFQVDELNRLPLEKLDVQLLEQDLETLQNAEDIKQTVQQTAELMDGEEGVVQRISAARNSLGKYSELNKELSSFHERVEAMYVEARDLSSELIRFGEGIEYDPERIQEIADQVNQLNHLLQKHRLQNTVQLVELRETLSAKLYAVDTMDEKVLSLRNEIAATESQMAILADKLNKNRLKAASKLESEVLNYFAETGLQHAALKCEVENNSEFSVYGRDKIQFLFRANKGGSLLPVGQVASGGEMSRVMLALKSLVSRYKSLPVLILDEIDQGISGEVANKVGFLLKDMSANMQLICITHLPQIAGKANHHFKVLKEVQGEKTVTMVKSLNPTERVDELAEMLGGKDFSKATRQSARELLSEKK